MNSVDKVMNCPMSLQEQKLKYQEAMSKRKMHIFQHFMAELSNLFSQESG